MGQLWGILWGLSGKVKYHIIQQKVKTFVKPDYLNHQMNKMNTQKQLFKLTFYWCAYEKNATYNLKY